MSSSQDLLALAERCEAATGADRELDAAIAYQHHGFYVRKEGQPLGRQCYDTHGIAVELPRYTASLDAAMMLVPDNCGVQVDNGPSHWIALGQKESVCGRAEVDYPNPEYAGQGDSWLNERSLAQTMPLALCAAALRARAQVQS